MMNLSLELQRYVIINGQVFDFTDDSVCYELPVENTALRQLSSPELNVKVADDWINVL